MQPHPTKIHFHCCASMAHQGFMDFDSIVSAEILRQVKLSDHSARYGVYAFHNSSGCFYFLIFPFSLMLISFLIQFVLCKAISVYVPNSPTIFLSFTPIPLSFYIFSQISSFIGSTFLLPLPCGFYPCLFFFVLLKSQRIVWLPLEPS